MKANEQRFIVARLNGCRQSFESWPIWRSDVTKLGQPVRVFVARRRDDNGDDEIAVSAIVSSYFSTEQ